MKKILVLLFVLFGVPVYAAQPTIGSQSATGAATSVTNVNVATVDTGAGMVVMVFQQSGTLARTYAVTDAQGNTYTSQTDSGCGTTAHCAQIFADFDVTGAAPLQVTITQSGGSFQAYHVQIFEVNCDTICAQDVASFITNASGTSHPTAATGALDTVANVAIMNGCIYTAGGVTDTAATNYETATGGSSATGKAFEDDIATAFTDENGAWTTTTSVGSVCVSIAVASDSGLSLTIDTTSLPNAKQNVAYDSGLILASGGTTPYTWAESGASLGAAACTGLTLTDNMDDTAEVTGTPTVAGVCSFTLEVTDAAMDTDQQAFTINVTTGGSALIGGGLLP